MKLKIKDKDTVRAAKHILKQDKSSDIQRQARKYSPDALRALRDVLRSKMSTDLAKISAATALLDRGFGRPSQTNINAAVNTDGPPSKIEEIELNRRITDCLERIEGATRRTREKIKSPKRPVDIRQYN